VGRRLGKRSLRGGVAPAPGTFGWSYLAIGRVGAADASLGTYALTRALRAGDVTRRPCGSLAETKTSPAHQWPAAVTRDRATQNMAEQKGGDLD